MRNITVSVPEDVYRAARVRAAERGKSLSALVADYLRSLSDRDSGRTRFQARWGRLLEQVPEGFSASENISRDELHERAVR